MRSINNRGELSSAIAKFETPAIGVSDMISIGNQVIAGTYRGNLIVFGWCRKFKQCFFNLQIRQNFMMISHFHLMMIFLYRLTKRGLSSS
jgi:hypothetical protein